MKQGGFLNPAADFKVKDNSQSRNKNNTKKNPDNPRVGRIGQPCNIHRIEVIDNNKRKGDRSDNSKEFDNLVGAKR